MEEEVGVKVEAALGYDVGLQRADGSGGGVARVGRGGEALRLALFVELAEGGVGHDDLAAQLEVGGQASGGQLRCRNTQRDGADGADVRGDILADGPVAAGESALEAGGTVRGGRIEQGKREAVELELADVAHVSLLGRDSRRRLPGVEVGLVVGVVEREHGAGVRRLDEAVAGLAADTLGGGVGRDEFGMGRFERTQAIVERIVPGVGELGRVEHIVEMLVAAQLLAQGFDLLAGGGFGRHSGMIIESAGLPGRGTLRRRRGTRRARTAWSKGRGRSAGSCWIKA